MRSTSPPSHLPRIVSYAAAFTTAATMSGTVLAADDTTLIPRSVIFGNPERASPSLSPDGTQVAFVAPLNGVMNVWVAPLEVKNTSPDGVLASSQARPVTKSTDRPIGRFSWAHNNEQILYMMDRGGNENHHVYAVDLKTGEERDLTPGDETKAQILDIDKAFPNEVLIMSNARNPMLMDAYRVNTRTGAAKMIFENDAGWLGVTPDASWAIRARAKMGPDGSMTTEVRDSADGEWYTFLNVPFEDSQTTSFVGFSKDGKSAFMIDSRGRNTAGLFSVVPSPTGGEPKLIFSNDKADVSGAMVNPDTREIEAVESEFLRTDWKILSDAVKKDFASLAKLDSGDFDVTSRTDDDTKWVVSYRGDTSPTRWWLWDRSAGKGVFLGSSRPTLKSMPLQPMMTLEIPARDGLMLPSYLTLPNKDAKNVPLVLFVHGGPWARDSWGFHPYHQWLANRGYAVLSVNFRGSTGFGKNFLNAGNRQWFAKMQDDLNDAVEWAVKKGYADPKRVAIMGGSYGGYATLAGLTRDPELFACGVDIVGPSHIATLLKSVPPYWKPMLSMFETRVGALSETEFLDSISPLTHVENIRRPLLIGQGANDPRVKIHESDQIVSAMKNHQLPVTYVVFPDEGHGFARPVNNMAFQAVTEAFLAKYLGGRAEPVGEDVQKSTAQVRELGGINLPGVKTWTPSASD